MKDRAQNKVEINLLLREGMDADRETLEPLFALAVECTLLHFALPRPSVNIVISDDEELQALNKQWRGLDRPTDVLSFAEQEGAPLTSLSPKTFLGDIIISAERATAQGRDLGHGTVREMTFLVVHGLLHLLGYDHMEPEEEWEMLAMQREIMEEIGEQWVFSVKGKETT